MTQMAEQAAQEEFPAILHRVTEEKERVVLYRDGKPVAAVIPAEDLDLLERLIEEEEDRIDIAEAERVLNDPNEVFVPWEQVKQELGLD